jgi:hypothetical protein
MSRERAPARVARNPDKFPARFPAQNLKTDDMDAQHDRAGWLMADMHPDARGASQERDGPTDGPGLGRPRDPRPPRVRALSPPRPCLGCGRPFTPRRADQRHCDGRCRAQAARDANHEHTRTLVVALDAAIALGNYHAARHALARLAAALGVPVPATPTVRLVRIGER